MVNIGFDIGIQNLLTGESGIALPYADHDKTNQLTNPGHLSSYRLASPHASHLSARIYRSTLRSEVLRGNKRQTAIRK